MQQQPIGVGTTHVLTAPATCFPLLLLSHHQKAAAAHLQKAHGLDEADASQLAAALSKLGVADSDGVDVRGLSCSLPDCSRLLVVMPNCSGDGTHTAW